MADSVSRGSRSSSQISEDPDLEIDPTTGGTAVPQIFFSTPAEDAIHGNSLPENGSLLKLQQADDSVESDDLGENERLIRKNENKTDSDVLNLTGSSSDIAGAGAWSDIANSNDQEPPATLLRRALKRHPHKEKGFFLPINALEDIIREDRVLQWLKANKQLQDLTLDELIGVVKQICEDQPIPSGSQKAKYKSFRKVFAILVLLGKEEAIQDFIKEDISDQDLPLRVLGEYDKYVARRKSKDTVLNSFKNGWSDLLLDSFDNYQWWITAPYFYQKRKGSQRKPRFFEFHDSVILPFIEDNERETEDGLGGFSNVWQVKIHDAHHDFCTGSNHHSKFAQKRLHSRSRKDWWDEFQFLRRVSSRNHPHLIKLLSSFKFRGTYRFLFPWADANLRDFWMQHPNPHIDQSFMLWVAQQCQGIASGLYEIHNYHASNDLLHPAERALYKRYGMHNDLKPENILWFSMEPNAYGHGLVQIADFGLSSFHGTTSRSNFRAQATSPSYRAPECDTLPGTISRAFDIWTLGCLYLEFITWFLAGWRKVDQFSEARLQEDLKGITSDTFFAIHHSRQVEKPVALVKPEVENWIMELHENENCTEYLHNFLNLIQLEMLVVERTARSEIGVIHTKLKDWYESCRMDEVFCNKPAPWKKSSRKGLSEMPARVVELSADDRKKLVELDLPKHNGEVMDGTVNNAPRGRRRSPDLQNGIHQTF